MKIDRTTELPLIIGILCQLLLLFPQLVSGQPVVDSSFYGPVLDFQRGVSGNFGELRSNHFHSGIDFKTGEKEGVSVYAAADGYISRVKVSSRGYGKVLYINHTNNTTTVYGHLRAFTGPLDSLIKNTQLLKKEFEIEIFPESEQFPVKAHQVIGISGNSGGSTGPHLHFEIRNTKTEKPFNPELSGFKIHDTIAPILENIFVYHPGPANGLQGCERKIISNKLGAIDTMRVNKTAFIGFESYDLANDNVNKLGIRAFQLLINDEVKFNCNITEFAFDETRMINAFIDHSFKAKTGRTIVLCFLLPGNQLKYYEKTDGKITINHDQTAKCLLKIEDTSGNFIEKEFIILGDTTINSKSFIPKGKLLKYNETLQVTEKNYGIKFMAGSFYEDVWITQTSVDLISTTFHSTLVSIDANNAAFRLPFELTIAVKENGFIDESKFVIAILDSSGIKSGPSSTYSDGVLKTTTRNTGNFVVVVDTIAPVVSSAYWKLDDYTGKSALVIPISDSLSGLKKYDCYSNDVWICGEYNEMRQEITLYIDDIPLEGKISVKLTDHSLNSSAYTMSVDWDSMEIIQY